MKIEKIIHRNEPRLLIELAYSKENIETIKKVSGARWSATYKAWHIPLTTEAFGELARFFPEVGGESHLVKNITGNVEVVPFSEPQKPNDAPVQKSDVNIFVANRKIAIKMARNDADIAFIKTIMYNRWNQELYLWEVPDYVGNLEKIKQYFKDRIASIAQPAEINIKAIGRRLGANEILCIKTLRGRMKIIGKCNEELVKHIRKVPYSKWDKENKWWTIPYLEKFLNEIRQKANEQGFVVKYEEEREPENKVPKVSASTMPNYRTCPESYVDKLIELRYSTNTIRNYKSHFEEFINYYPQKEIEYIDEPMITAFLRFLVTERKISASYQNLAINAIKFYYEKVLAG